METSMEWHTWCFDFDKMWCCKVPWAQEINAIEIKLLLLLLLLLLLILFFVIIIIVVIIIIIIIIIIITILK